MSGTGVKRKREGDLGEKNEVQKPERQHEDVRELIESELSSLGETPPTINPGEGESVFGVPQVALPQPDTVNQAFNRLRDTLELTEDDPDARLKAKHSKSKKKRKSKYRKSKHIKSKRRKSKRKKKKRKHH